MLNSVLKPLGYALSPLVFLFTLVILACLCGYGILQIAGDIIPLSKLIGKLTQILLVLSIFPLRRYFNLTWSEIGFAQKSLFFKQLRNGLIIGLVTLLPVILLLYGLDVNVVDESRIWTVGLILKKAAIALFLAILISLLEEPIFRGLLLINLQRKINLSSGIFLSAFYYTYLHFLNSSTLIPYQDMTLSSGFILFAQALANSVNPVIFPAFIGLFAVGIFLAVLRTHIQHSLGLCIGIHASWVWQIKLSKDFFNTNFDSPYFYLVSHYDGLVGPLVAVWLLAATLVFWLYLRLKKNAI